MLTLLLLSCFLLIFLIRLGSRDPEAWRPGTWQGDYLLSAAVFSAVLVGMTELLTLFHAITQTGLALAWGGILLTLVVLAVRTGVIGRGWRRLKEMLVHLERAERWLLATISALCLVLFAVALASPPNNIDSLQYHMSRVMHWAQNQSIKHYTTVIMSQNIRPYFAEAAILHARVLWGSDQPASLIQWFAMVGSLIATTGIAANLGGGKRARWLSLVFSFTVPMGLLQATTTQNDYVSTYWVMSLAYFITMGIGKPHNGWQRLGLALSLGLGMLTKGTFFPFAGPLMLWYVVHTLLHQPFKKTFQEGLLIAIVAGALNAGFWARNITTYGGPYGPYLPIGAAEPAAYILPASIQENRSRSEGAVVTPLAQSEFNPPLDPGIITAGFNPSTSAGTFIRAHLEKALRLVTMHFVSPFHGFNQRLFSVLDSIPELFPDTYRRGMRLAIWNYEMHAGSPVHLALIFFSTASLGLTLRRSKETALSLTGTMLIGFLLLTFLDNSDNLYSIRYQLPFLLLGTSLAGTVIEGINLRGTRILMPLLLLYALPYILISNQRPIIGMTPWPTRVGSVFSSSPSELVFAQAPDHRADYLEIAAILQASPCRDVGLDLSGRAMEYLFWWSLDAPQSGIRVEHIGETAFLGPKPGYQPCAVICTTCEGDSSYRDLPIVRDHRHTQLFMNASFFE